MRAGEAEHLIARVVENGIGYLILTPRDAHAAMHIPLAAIQEVQDQLLRIEEEGRVREVAVDYSRDELLEAIGRCIIEEARAKRADA